MIEEAERAVCLLAACTMAGGTPTMMINLN
jgi:hypothetical protein